MHLTRPSLLTLLGVVSLWMMTSCSRTKDTTLSRTYHWVTGRDNFFFNGRQQVKDGAVSLAGNHVDHYDRLLSIFRYADEKSAKSITPQMDEAIKRFSIVIQRHSMVFKGKEKNRWVKESYLWMGNAQFYKHDYWAAIETYQFVSSTYSGDAIRYDALMMLAQSYLELGKTLDAEFLLDYMRNDKSFPWKKRSAEFFAISANYNLQKNNYEKAAEDLSKAISFAKSQKVKARYHFILGQLYQKMEKFQEAFNNYQLAMRKAPSYEMEFNARISRAQCYDITTGSREIKDQLEKMLHDDKNKDYLDQIYYSLATIAFKENNPNEAIDLLQLSVGASTLNTNQKALSYVALADYYYNKADYRKAQAFYDSTITFLSTDHPDFDRLSSRKMSLTRLVRNLNTIATEDSLLALSMLSVSEREKLIQSLIEKENELIKQQMASRDSMKQDEKELEELPMPGQPYNRSMQDAPQIAGGWYFYNPSTVDFGIKEFTRKWGNRKLEDNWRRSKREEVLELTDSGEAMESDDQEDIALQEAKRDSIMKLDSEQRAKLYLENIPSTAEQINQSNERILEAYYNAGLIYKEQLENNKAAAEDLEIMMKRYPENKFMLPAYYNLYRIYLAMNDTAKAGFYKDILLTRYEDSEYARLITNPNYYQEKLKKTAVLQVYYENTFRAYKNGQFQDVINRKMNADSLFPPNELTPRFAFLEALAIGKIKPQPEFEASLKTIVARYPNDSVSIRAQEILDMMAKKPVSEGDSGLAAEPVKEQIPEPSPYYFGSDTVQYFVVAWPVGSLDLNDMKGRISDFNSVYYSTDNLQFNDAFFGMETQFIMVRSFPNRNKALKYYKDTIESDDIFNDIDLSTIFVFLITPDNMITLAQKRNLEQYQDFFNTHYTK